MNLTYYLLASSVLVALFYRKPIVLNLFLIFTSVVALHQGVVDSAGLAALGVLWLLTKWFYSITNNRNWIEDLLFVLITVTLGALILHFVPGFANKLVLNKVTISPGSHPYTMYLNFDKVMAALIVFSCSNFLQAKNNINSRMLMISGAVFLACITTLFLPAVISGVVKFEPKLPSYFGLWALNNLVFVCFSEEVIFRGFLQHELANRIGSKRKAAWLPIMLAAVMFGLYHYKSGPLFIAVSALAGLFYGYAFYKTRNILCTILVHFGVNLTHFIFFTYP